MNQRQKEQQQFELSGENLVVGEMENCPIDLEQLASTTSDSPYVVETFQSGLTAEVFRLRFAGKDYTLKKKRPVAKVQNLDGQFSFLNEVQRRADLQRHKDNPATSDAFECIVPTVYADYRLGIILSDWIEAEPISKITHSLLEQLFSTLTACERIGLFEWDLCAGNLLVDANGKLWLFDFGYMYRFDPLNELNSNGMSDPLFELCERFETRFLSGWFLEQGYSISQSLSVYRKVKRQALKALTLHFEWLQNQNASKPVLMAKRQQITDYQIALANERKLKQLFEVEMFRSHVLDIEDDLAGRSCTPTTIKRVEAVLAMIKDAYPMLNEKGALFYHNHGKNQAELIDSYQTALSLVKQYQI